MLEILCEHKTNEGKENNWDEKQIDVKTKEIYR